VAKRVLLATILALLIALPVPVSAHLGPAYQVLSEAAVGPYTVTVWADPDVGTGTLLIETAIRDLPPPPGTEVIVTAWPADDPQATTETTAERQDEGSLAAYTARVAFDREGEWNVRVQFAGPAPPGQVEFPLQVTPAYPEWFAYAGCFIPLIAICAMWIVGVRRQRQAGEGTAPAES
jgi:hypothetical protein